MYKRLLVAVDGSTKAEAILPYALGISRATGSPLTLVRVLEGGVQDASKSGYVDALAAKLNVEGRSVSTGGDVASAILEEAARVPATLVAMTSQGHSGVLGVILGSVAMEVLRRGGGPVLIYHPHERFSGDQIEAVKIKRIIAPMDGTPNAESIGKDAGEVARWLGAELVVISVLGSGARPVAGTPVGDVSESSYVRSRAIALGKQYGVEVSWEVLHGDEPEQAVADFVGNDRGTMLAMVTRANAAPLAAALLGSVTTGCLRKVGVPVLMRLP